MGRVQTALTHILNFARVWAPRLLRALIILATLFIGLLALVAFVVLKRQGDLPRLGPAVGGLVAFGLFVLLLLSLWWVPRRQARAVHGDAASPDRAALEDRLRRTLAGVVFGVVLILLLGNALRMATALQANATSAQLLRATDALGRAELTARVAGVHALGALAEASDAARRPVYETLLAFVRQRAPDSATSDSASVNADVAAAVKIISRRASDGDSDPLHPDFSGANLRGASLAGAQWDFATLVGTHLEGADLRGSHIAGKRGSDMRGVHLDSADLSSAHLDGARLTEGAVLAHANMRRTDLDGATMRDADLRHARLDSAGLAGATLNGARLDSASLKGADLAGATLTGAVLIATDFSGAVLENAHLKGTDLSRARGLTAQQLARAWMDETTILPPGIPRPPQVERPR